MPEKQLLVITGPTASGKTALAASVAARLDGEVISADSRQVYRGMDIGTGKDLGDYFINGRQVRCHLIDIVDPGYEYNVFEFRRDFARVFEEVSARGKLPLLCGGTGMYIDSVVRDYGLVEVPENRELRESLKNAGLEELRIALNRLKPGLHNISDTTDRERAIRAIEIQEYHRKNPEKINPLKFNKLKIYGIRFERQELKDRISRRLEARLEAGMVEEVRGLMLAGVPAEKLLFYGLEYRWITEYLLGRVTYAGMVDKLQVAIFQFSKRQVTWFRRMERLGVEIQWVDGRLPLGDKLNFIVEGWMARV